MSRRSEIKYDFDLAKRKADDLDGLASDIDAIVKDQEEAVSVLKGSWDSTNSVQYYNKTVALIEDFKRQAKNLRNAASSLREAARRIYEAELRNIELEERRNSEN